MKDLKRIFQVFWELWVNFFVLSIPLILVIWFKLIPIQIEFSLFLIVYLITLIFYFKWVSVFSIKQDKFKALYFVTFYIVFFIFSFILSQVLHNSDWVWYKNIFFYSDQFPDKIWLDINDDGFVDIEYNAHNQNYSVPSIYFWINILLFALIFLFVIRNVRKDYMSIFIILIGFVALKVNGIATYAPRTENVGSHRSNAVNQAVEGAESVVDYAKSLEDELEKELDEEENEENLQQSKQNTTKSNLEDNSPKASSTTKTVLENKSSKSNSKKLSPEMKKVLISTYKDYVSKGKDLTQAFVSTHKVLKKVLQVDDYKGSLEKFLQKHKNAQKILADEAWKLNNKLNNMKKSYYKYTKTKKILKSPDSDVIKQAKSELSYLKTADKLIKTFDYLSTALDVVDTAWEFQQKALAENVKLDNSTAMLASVLNNSMWNFLSSNPWDETANLIGEWLSKVWSFFDSSTLKNIWNSIKDNLTLGWNFKQTIEFAVTTSDKTFELMKNEYDYLYKQESKNKGIMWKTYTYLKYKVVGKTYYYGVKLTSKIIKGVGKLWNKLVW